MNAIVPFSILGTFIASLRKNAPIFAGRVAGAAEFYKGLRDYNENMLLPAAYVLPLGQDAERNTIQAGGFWQLVHKGIGIAVELNAQRDRRGQDPTMSFETIEAQIMRSCLNMYLGECRMNQGSYFTGARYLDLDRARLWYQWEFALDWQIYDSDGVQPDEEPPLLSLEVDYWPTPVETGEEPAIVQQIIGDGPPTDGPWPGPDTEESNAG